MAPEDVFDALDAVLGLRLGELHRLGGLEQRAQRLELGDLGQLLGEHVLARGRHLTHGRQAGRSAPATSWRHNQLARPAGNRAQTKGQGKAGKQNKSNQGRKGRGGRCQIARDMVYVRTQTNEEPSKAWVCEAGGGGAAGATCPHNFEPGRPRPPNFEAK